MASTTFSIDLDRPEGDGIKVVEFLVRNLSAKFGIYMREKRERPNKISMSKADAEIIKKHVRLKTPSGRIIVSMAILDSRLFIHGIEVTEVDDENHLEVFQSLDCD